MEQWRVEQWRVEGGAVEGGAVEGGAMEGGGWSSGGWSSGGWRVKQWKTIGTKFFTPYRYTLSDKFDIIKPHVSEPIGTEVSLTTLMIMESGVRDSKVIPSNLAAFTKACSSVLG